MVILVVAVVLGNMTLGVQIIKAHLVQLGRELEEASSASGATWSETYWRVVLPLIGPAVATVGILIFANAVRAVSLVALLSTRPIQPLAVLQLDYLADGSFEAASVVGVIILLLSVGVALLGRWVGLQHGPGRAPGERRPVAKEASAGQGLAV
jgi:iron(III) transport system permease protein